MASRRLLAVLAVFGLVLAITGGAQATEAVSNGNFESGLTGWAATNGTPSLASDGTVGPGAGKVTLGATVQDFWIYASPRPVLNTSAGTAYTSGAWMRSDTPGKSVCLRVREWTTATPAVLAGAQTSCAASTAAWQHLSLTYTTVGSGNQLALQVYETGAVAADTFEVDGISLDGYVPSPLDTTPPETTIDSGPSGATTATSATFTFSSSEPSSTFECSLDSPDVFTTCTSPQAYSSLAIGSHTFRVRATDAAANVDPTPASRTWTVENPAPPPPAGELLPNPNFEDGLNGWAGNNATLTPASDGNVGPGAAKVALNSTATEYFIFASPRPVLSTTAGTPYAYGASVRSDTPGKSVCVRIREWTTASVIAGAQASCVTSTGAWQPLSLSYTAVGSGNEIAAQVYQAAAVTGDTFEVDGASLTAGTAPTDTTPPDTTIDSGPSGTVPTTSASFTFSATEPGSTFECALDSPVVYTTCSSPKDYTGLGVGDHTFRVRATDAAHNVDATPASRTWTIGSPPPTYEYLSNGSFESGLTGWSATNGTLTLASDGAVGPGAGKVALNTTPQDFWLYGNPRPVLSTTAGSLFNAKAQVRSDTPGKSVCLRLREWTTDAAPVLAGAQTACATSMTAWQQLAVTYTTVGNGNQLALQVYETGAATGDTFEADAISLTSTTPPPDTTPPQTTIDSGPSGTGAPTTANVHVLVLRGRLDVQVLPSTAFPFLRPPARPRRPRLANGSHTFEVAATDPAANADPTPASRTWSVGAPPPTYEYLPNGKFENGLNGWQATNGTLSAATDGNSGPGAAKVTLGATVQDFWLFASPRPVLETVAGTAYTISANIRSATPGKSVCVRLREWTKAAVLVGTKTTCATSTTAWQQLAPAVYTTSGTGNELAFQVYETGAVAGDSFEVDAASLNSTTPPPDQTPPDTTITSGPSGNVTSTSASFAFTATEAGSTFACSLDNAAFSACTSPKAYSSLSYAPHSFQVKATDPAGNVDPTPAVRSWTVTNPAPQTTEMLTNGDFEGGLTGWTETGGTLTLANDGNVGSKAGKLTKSGGGNGTFTLTRTSPPVSSTPAGASYSSFAWIRSSQSGRSVCLRLTERTSGGSTVATKQGCLTTTTAWQKLTPVTHTAAGAGHTLSLEIYESGSKNDSFEADGVSLTQTATPPAPPSPATIVAAGDIASCTSEGDTQTATHGQQHHGLCDRFKRLRNANPNGSAADFANCYQPTCGAGSSRTRSRRSATTSTTLAPPLRTSTTSAPSQAPHRRATTPTTSARGTSSR